MIAGGPWNPPGSVDEGPTPWAWLLLLTALGVVLRVPGLNDGLWIDELITVVESVRYPLSRIVSVFPGDNQHTFYSVLASLSITAFGEHNWSLRLPAMVMGAATVPLVYFFAREFTGRTEALLSSLLLAAAYHHVWFSQNARGYSTLTFLTVLSSWLLLRGLRRTRTSDWIGYAVTAALGVYTHLTMVLLLATHALLCVGYLGLPFGAGTVRRWRLPAIGFALTGLLSLLLYAPVLFDVRVAVVDAPAPMAGATTGWAVAELLKGLQIGFGSLVGVLVGAVVFVVGLWSYLKQSRWLVGLFLAPGVMIASAAVALQRPVRPRFFFFLVAFALLVVVRGALEIGRLLSRARESGRTRTPALGVVIVAGLAVLSIAAIAVESKYPKQDFDGAMRLVDVARAEGDPVVTAGGARYAYLTYYQRNWEHVRSLSDLRAMQSRGRPVWVVFTLKAYIDRDLMRVLDAECAIAKVFPGTLRGGEMTVCTVPPLSVAPNQ